jgi:hypothetical protein
LGRKRNEKDPKECEIIDRRIIIEVNGVENIFEGNYAHYGTSLQFANIYQHCRV